MEHTADFSVIFAFNCIKKIISSQKTEFNSNTTISTDQ